MSNQLQQSYVRRIQNIQSHIVNNVENDTLYDCIVIGGGITGASACYQLSKDGLKVLMLEQFEEAHDKASSHGDGRIIRFSYPEDVYIRLAKLSYEIWSEIEDLSKTKLIHITGGLDIGIPGSKAILDLIESYKKNNIKYEILTKKEAELRFPQYNFKIDDVIVYQKDSGVVYASKAVKAIWKLSREKGANILDNKKVSRIKVEQPQSLQQSITTVLCEDQTVYKTKKVVLACGGWINQILHNSQLNLTLPLEITQEKVFYWGPKLNNTIDYTQYSNPVSIYYGQEDCFYSLPQIDIKGVKLGYHHSGNVLETMDSKKYEYNEENVKKVKEFVGSFMPGLVNEKELNSVLCHYTNTSDYHFIIDKHPRFSNIVIASPCSGHGFKFGPSIGKLISHLVQNKPNPIERNDEFLIKRFTTPGYGFQKRISA